MIRISAKTRIAIGQVCLLISALLAAMLLGLIPDDRAATMRGRVALCEALAIDSSLLLAGGEMRRMEALLDALVRRNHDLRSAAVRRADGKIVVQAGAHAVHWRKNAGTKFSDEQIHVPIHGGPQRWGRVEFCFRPPVSPGLLGWLAHSRLRLVIFISAATFLMFYVYLSFMLNHLDPARAVPGRVRQALDTLTEGLVVLDTKHRIVLANTAFAKVVGETAEAVMGYQVEDFGWSPATGAGKIDLPWEQTLERGRPSETTMLQLVDAQSQERTFLTNCAPVLGHDGKYRGVLVSFEDVTPLEEKKVELSRAKTAAEEASRTKTEFLANMSHEIRTPMNAILGFTDVLRRGFERDGSKRRQHLNTIHTSGQHLLNLINDILDLSKVESGRLELEQVKCSPHRIVAEVLAVLRVKADEKNISLDYQPHGTLPETIVTDPGRLRQTLMNLVGNAIKFTDQGGVRVIASLDDQADGTKFVIKVADSGVGMSPAALQRIFDPFAQADASVTRKFGGTGLGLSISKQFVEALGGQIEVTSQPGKGSVFTITLEPGSLDDIPMIDAAAAAVDFENIEQEHLAIELPPLRVLVVDDAEENRNLLAVFLDEAEVAYEMVENGQQAMERALAEDWDAIMMDMQMPVMDGYTATRNLRAEGYEVPIIALTAHAMRGDEEKCLDAGCSGFLSKPIDFDQLILTLAEIAGVDTSEMPDTSNRSDRSRTSDRSDRSGTSGVSAQSCQIGSQLPMDKPRFRAIVEKFLARLPDLLVQIDAAFQQPDFDQLADLAHQLKGASLNVGFPQLGEVASELEQMAQQRDSGGIPARLCEMRTVAAKLVVEPTTETRPYPTPATADSVAGHAVECVGDVGPLLSTRPLQNARLRAAVQTFVDQLDEHLNSLQAACQSQDYYQLGELAHRLKGSSANCGFQPLSDVASEVERLAQQEAGQEIPQLLEELRNLKSRILIPEPGANFVS